jgi:hypothetical protein
MSMLSFDDPGDPVYEIYDGPLACGVYVRVDGHLVGVSADWPRARALMASDKSRRERWERENPVFHMAA